MHCLPRRIKSMFFFKYFLVKGARKEPGMKKKFQNSLILDFEVIVQTHFGLQLTFFEKFSSLQVAFGNPPLNFFSNPFRALEGARPNPRVCTYKSPNEFALKAGIE